MPPGLGAPAGPRAAMPPAGPPPTERPIKLLLRLNLDFGGDDIVKVTLTDGSMRTLTAGQGGTLGVGLMYLSPAWALEATVGYKFALMNFSNGNIDFTRIPIDAIASLVEGRHRLGIGGTVHMQPTFSCQVGGVCADSVTLDPAFGAIAQYAYRVRTSLDRGVELGVRYTYLKYAAPDGSSVDGSSVGVVLGGQL